MQTVQDTSFLKYMIPAVILFLLGPALAPVLLTASDVKPFLLYCLAFVLFALLTRPLTEKLFPDSPDGGWLYGKLLGLILPALTAWLAAYAGLPLFTGESLLLLALFWAFLLYFLGGYFRPGQLKRRFKPRRLALCLAESGCFFLLFLFWSFVRSLKPEVHGLEKFMDYGFMMSMWRNPKLPALDMWLAGSDINYYYFGQYLFTALAKLCRVHPSYAYNLSVAASFALSFVLAFALIRDALQDKAAGRPARQRNIASYAGALAGAALLTLGGNSHAFFYAPNRPGKAFLSFLQRMGVNVGDTVKYFFSDSTRFIGYNPETTDKTIHEFPFYSYLVADLHAHMVNLSLVLLLLACFYSLYKALRTSKPVPDPTAKRTAARRLKFWPRELKELSFILSGILLGLAAMGNYWDYVIYIVVAFLLLLAANGGRAELSDLGGAAGFGLMLGQLFLLFFIFLKVSDPLPQLLFFVTAACLNSFLAKRFPSVFARAAGGLGWLFVLAQLTSLSFNLGFEPMSKALVPTTQRSSLLALFILWFAHAAIALIYLICFFVFNRRKLKSFTNKSPLARLLALDTSSLFFFGLICCGLGLILAPELIYVRDIYEGSFSRANTMFKFTYQAFSLLSLGAGFTFGLLLLRALPRQAEVSVPAAQRTNSAAETSLELPKRYQDETRRNRAPYPWPRLLPLILTGLLLTVPFAYTPEIQSWYGPLSLARRQGLEGTAYLGRQSYVDDKHEAHPLADRLQVINWFNKEVKGQPNILEAFGLSYTDYCSVSAYTGLPTVLGWQTHEWLWRTSATEDNAFANVVAPLQDKITAFYENPNPDRQRAFLQEYKISYVVVGELERARFKNINEDSIKKLGNIVFSAGDDYVVKVR